MIRITVFLILMGISQVFALETYSQATRLTLKLNNAKFDEVLKEIEKKSEFFFIYNRDLIDVEQKVEVSVEEKSINEVLDILVAGKGIHYYISDRQIVLSRQANEPTATKAVNTYQQQVSVKGTVTDINNTPLPGVTVIVKGTTNGTITDNNGTYTISNVSANSVLVYSFVGMRPQEIELNGRTTINVALEEESIGIEEVVAIGYGTQKKRDIIGSISTITTDELTRAASAGSFDAAMQGLAPGLMVSSESGIPGAPVQVKIRGISSISSGTDPLWIVDGIPIVNESLGNTSGGVSRQNVMSLINPSDIESIQVLKDAAATSIYGSRGSNGVILVTTKSGKEGTMTMNVDLKSGVSNWANRDIGLANNIEFIEIMDRAYANSGRNELYQPVHSLNQIDGVVAQMTREEALATNTDWGDIISRTGSFIEANVSASQGTERGNSYISLRYRKDNSILKYNDLQIFSANANLNYKPFERFRFNYRGFVSYSDNNRVNSQAGKGGAGGWAQVNAFSLPWMKVYDHTETGVNGFWNPLSRLNALAGMSPLNTESNLQVLNVLQGLNGELEIMEGFTLKGEFGANIVNDKQLSWMSEAIRIEGAQASEYKYNRTVLNYNAFFNYDRILGNDHWLNVVGGIENTRRYVHTTAMSSQALIGRFHEVGTPESLSGSSTLGGESYLRGYFGRANYKFKDRYIIGTSIRRDGISKFTPENRWATFMSGSAGWIISDESFFNVDAINMLKLRGSFGQTGNTNIPTGITSDRYSVTDGLAIGFPRTAFSSIGNSDIKWETTSTTDIGIDFGLFQNRIDGSIAYYRQEVEDMLLAVALPYSAGIEGGNIIWQNIGDMENKGIEFNMNAAILNKGFKWDVGFNISTNKNKILALDPETDANNVGILQLEPYEDKVITIFKTGLPVGNWYMAESAGVDPEKGIPMIYEVEVNEDGTTSHTGNIIPGTTDNLENNRMILEGKTSLPKILGGFNSQFAFKNFDLGLNFSFAAGHFIYNRLLQSSLIVKSGERTLSHRLLTESWEKPGDNAKWPQVVMNVQYPYDNNGDPTAEPVKYGNDEKYISTMFLEKGDYLKLNNVTLGYTLPARTVSRIGMNSLRLSVNVTNVLTLTEFSGYNPEVPIHQESAASFVSYSSIPLARTYSFGLNVNF